VARGAPVDDGGGWRDASSLPEGSGALEGVGVVVCEVAQAATASLG
jgi:hypothetical protein